MPWSLLTASAILALIAAFLVFEPQPMRLDPDDPDLRLLQNAVVPNREGPFELDLSEINGGDWTVLCLVDDYQEPLEALTKQGKPLKITRSQRWAEGAVEENEVAVAYADGAGNVKIIRELSGWDFGFTTKCAPRERPKLMLEPGRKVRPLR